MIADDDPLARRLFEAVWAEPAADGPRMVLADYLLERGDPMGEMIVLQLERSRTGAAISERELEVVVVYGRQMLGPHAIWLRDWVFERGFPRRVTPADNMPPATAAHPMWSTVGCIELTSTADHPILANPQLRPVALHATPEVVIALARRTAAVPVRALTSAYRYRGIEPDAEVFAHRGGFDRVRALSLQAWHFEHPSDTDPILESRLVRQLEHLDLTFDRFSLDELQRWHRRIAATGVARFSVQVPLGYRPEPGEFDESVFSGGPTHFTYVEVDGDRVIVQLGEQTSMVHVERAVALAGELAGDRTRLIVEDLHDASRCEERHPALLAGLRARFAEVTAGCPVSRRAP